MSPSVVGRNKSTEIKLGKKEFSKMKKDLIKIKRFVEKNFKFVGDKFSREVREIYYDNKKNKNIYGTTTLKEKLELEKEGIDLVGIPWVDDKEN